MREPPSGTIESVRDSLAGDDAEQVLALWQAAGMPAGDEARERLDQVVCVLRGDDDAVLGVTWAYADDLALIGGRRFWIYNSAVPAAAAGAGDALIEHTFSALEAEFDADSRGPVGLCVLVHDRAEMERRPEAVWEDPHMIYAGYRDDGAQVRIGYFAGARI